MSHTPPIRVVALSAGLRSPSSSRRLADVVSGAVVEHLARRGESAQVRTLEVGEHAIDVTFAFLRGERPPALAEALRVAQEADVLVVATPVYNGSYSGLFKSFVDLLDPAAMVGATVVLCATGGSTRHSLVIDHELRPLFAFFQSAPVPTGVYATSEDWTPLGRPGPALATRIDRAAWEATSLAPLGTSAPA
jgi:FMN reductase